MNSEAPLYNAGCCSIHGHHRLVLEINDLLSRLDVENFIPQSRDRNEYAPEIPGLISLITHNQISTPNVRAVFVEMLGEGCSLQRNDMQEVIELLQDLRHRWLQWQQNPPEMGLGKP
jgi:hypothetical protein